MNISEAGGAKVFLRYTAWCQARLVRCWGGQGRETWIRERSALRQSMLTSKAGCFQGT